MFLAISRGSTTCTCTCNTTCTCTCTCMDGNENDDLYQLALCRTYLHDSVATRASDVPATSCTAFIIPLCHACSLLTRLPSALALCITACNNLALDALLCTYTAKWVEVVTIDSTAHMIWYITAWTRSYLYIVCTQIFMQLLF